MSPKKSKEEIDREVADVVRHQPSRVDLAETYITRVDELQVLNEEQAAQIHALSEELLSTKELLENCTQSNLEMSRQLEAVVRHGQQDPDEA